MYSGRLDEEENKMINEMLTEVFQAEKNRKEALVWGVAQFGEMSYPGS